MVVIWVHTACGHKLGYHAWCASLDRGWTWCPIDQVSSRIVAHEWATRQLVTRACQCCVWWGHAQAQA